MDKLEREKQSRVFKNVASWRGIQVVAKKTAFQAAREVILAMEKIRRGTFMRRQSTIGNWKGTVQQEQPHTTECAWLTLIYPGFDFNERVK